MNTEQATEFEESKGSITLISGPMFSGKTLSLLRRVESCPQPTATLCFVPKIDKRYGSSVIAAHNGKKLPAIAISQANEIASHLQPHTQHVFIDEAQFLEIELVEVVVALKTRGIAVTLSGLDRKYDKSYFPTILALMQIADQHIQKQGTCAICSEPSVYSYRKTKQGHEILIGADNYYEGRCAECYHKKEAVVK